MESLKPQPQWLARYAQVLAAATFLLIIAGGLVTSFNVGMAVPDWPTTFGQNMFLYNWLAAPLGVFLEHSHRLLGAVIGLLTVGLAVWLWLEEPRSWVRWLGTAALVGVIVQGVLGGLRVTRVDLSLAVVHGCAAQAFLALVVALAVFLSPGWQRSASTAPSSDARRHRRLGLLTTGLIYLQIILGALLRQYGGSWLGWHLLVAVAVLFHGFFWARRVLDQHGGVASLVGPARMLIVFLGAQIALGVGALVTTGGHGTAAAHQLTRVEVFFATSHVALGSLLLACSVVLTLRLHRILAVPREHAESAGVELPGTVAEMTV